MSKLRERLLAFDGAAWSRKSRQPHRVERDNEVVAQEQEQQVATFYSKEEEDATSMVGHRQLTAGQAKAVLHSNQAEEEKPRRAKLQRRKRASSAVKEATASHSMHGGEQESERFADLLRGEQSDRRESGRRRRRSERHDATTDNKQRSQVTQQIGSAKEELTAAAAAARAEAPLIHTDQLNTTTRLLYIYPPSSGTDKPPQILANTHRNHYRNSMTQRRQRQHWRDQPGQMVAAASEPNGTDGPEQVARLEILNLEVTNSSVTLTWALSAVAPIGEQVGGQIGRRTMIATDEQKNGSSGSSQHELDSDLSRELKTLRSIAKRDTDSVRAGSTSDSDLADELTTPTDTERDKRFWIGPRGGLNKQKATGRSEELITTMADILRNDTGRTTDTPTSAPEPATRRPAQPHSEPNVIEALPASSVGPTRRPPNRNRSRPTQASGQVVVTSASTSWREPQTTRPLTQTVTSTTSSRPAATITTTTTKSSPATTPTSGLKSTEIALPKVTAIPTGTPRAQPHTTTSTTGAESSIERMASVPLNRLQPITSGTRPTKATTIDGEEDKSITGNTQLASSHAPPSPSSPARVTSTSVSVSVSAVTTTRHPAPSDQRSSQVPATTSTQSGGQQTPHARVAKQTTRAGKSVGLEPSDGTTSSILPPSETTEIRSSTTFTTPTTTTTTMTPVGTTGSSLPASFAPEQTTTTTTTRRPEVSPVSSTKNDNVPTTERHETAMTSTTRRDVEFVPPTPTTRGTLQNNPTDSDTNRTVVSRTPATPIGTTMTTPTSPAPPSQVISMSKSQLVTSESLKRKELATSTTTAATTTTNQAEDGATSAPPSAEFATTQPQRISNMPPPQPQPLSSKWLVRLRRFGSNEVDIVKVVVGDLGRLLREQQPLPLQRSITFKNLDPSSGYEICVESASPNQLISDKFQILNANHFLKCHDVSDVELTTGDNSTLAQGSGQESLRRLDLRRLDELAQVAANSNGDDLLTLNTTTRSQVPSVSANKMKSLCREFFTLATSDQRVASAQVVAIASKPVVANPLAAPGGDHQPAESAAGQPRRPKSLASQQQQQVAPSGALRSHVELMEIGGGANESRWQPTAGTFEMFASSSSSSGNLRPPVSLGSDSGNVLASLSNETTSLTGVTNRSTPLLPGSGPTNKLFGEGTHIVPIVGCVFVLIFLATIANMLLNLLHCDAPPRSRSSSDSAADMLAGQAGAGGRLSRHLAGHRDERRRRRRRRQRLTDALGGLGPVVATGAVGGHGSRSPALHNSGNLTSRSPAHQLLASTPTLLAGGRDAHHHHHHGKQQRHFSNSLSGSYYSNASDQSATSKSRIVIVGKNGEPFGSAVGHFDVPPERLLGSAASPLLRNQSPVDSSGTHQEANQSSSVYMLSSAVRFPLGPSFEGDEKHNADMVGLARRNYDNFINNIYNADEHTSELLANGNLNSGRHSHSHTTGRDCSADNQYQQVVVSSTLHEARARNAAASTTTSGTAPTTKHRQQQRLRFDKVNPIYNMDGIQPQQHQQQHRMSQQLASFGQQLPSPRQRGATDESHDTSHCLNNQGDEECSVCDLNPNDAPEHAGQSSPASSRSAGSSTSGLDKQKQRFQAQQQQLERVVSKSGSLVPQPFINVSSEVALEAESRAYSQRQQQHQQQAGGDHSTDISIDNLDQPSAAEFIFGDHRAGPPPPPNLDDDLGEPDRAAPTPPPPPPPAPLSPVGSPVPPPAAPKSVVRTKAAPGKEPHKQPLVNLQAIGGGGSQTAPSETIDKSDFAQRRTELASKLHLPGMTKE